MAEFQDYVTGTITAASGFGAGSPQGTGTVPAANSSLVLAQQYNHGSWTVQVTPATSFTGTLTFEVCAEPTLTYWIPVNSRQSAGGTLANNATAPGLFRGSFGGVRAIRVRALTGFTGVATVAITVGETAAIFTNSNVLSMTEEQYYASSAGKNAMYGATSDLLTFTGAPADQPYFSIYNPNSAGGVVFYVWRIALASTGAQVIRRRRFTGAATYGTGNTTPGIDNRGGVANTPTAVVHAGAVSTAITLPASPVLQKTVALNSNGASDTSSENFSLLIPPGQGIAFSATGAASSTASAEIVWSEGSTLT